MIPFVTAGLVVVSPLFSALAFVERIPTVEAFISCIFPSFFANPPVLDIPEL